MIAAVADTSKYQPELGILYVAPPFDEKMQLRFGLFVVALVRISSLHAKFQGECIRIIGDRVTLLEAFLVDHSSD